jgi:hypothetical protein
VYPSFSLLACFHAQYGSEVGFDYGAAYPASIASESGRQLRLDTCATQSLFVAHGFYRSWGGFAYANGTRPPTAVQQAISRCFAFGRLYGSGVNPDLHLVTAPFYQSTLSLNGGSCNTPDVACSAVFSRTYVLPSVIVAAAAHSGNAWISIQLYHLVTGSRASGRATWDCTSADPRLHWTNAGEFYCHDDLIAALTQTLSQRKPGTYLFVDPASAALIVGRGKPAGAR